MDQTFKHSISALAFITGLATVGVFSHMPQTGQLKFQDIVDGSLQARYERDFKSSNPLKAIAIASLGSVKYALFRQASTGAIIGKNGWFFTSEELEIVQNHDENLVQSATEISVIVDELSNKDIHLLPVIIPDKAEIYTDQLEVRLPDKIANRRINFLNSLVSIQGTPPILT